LTVVAANVKFKFDFEDESDAFASSDDDMKNIKKDIKYSLSSDEETPL
jgi:hypothetical protein